MKHARGSFLRRLQQVLTGGVVETVVFDADAYVRSHADLSSREWSRGEAFEHYVRRGRWEGREPSRRWPIPPRVLEWAQQTEVRVEETLLHARPWELAHRLRCKDGARRAFGRHSKPSARPVPDVWEARLADWALPTGWALATATVDAPPQGTVLSICALPEGASRPVATPLLECPPGAPATCVLRLARGAQILSVEARGPGRVRSLKVKPISWTAARDHMLQKLRSADAASRDRDLSLLHRRLETDELPFDEALWRTYSDSFGRAARRPTYEEWLRTVEWPRHLAFAEARERGVTADTSRRFSVLVPVHDPDPRLLAECLESVTRQWYPSWELCIADDGSKNPEVRSLLQHYARDSERIRLTRLDTSRHISHATNAALQMATGDFVAFLDHDDALSPFALTEVAEALSKNPGARVLYGDEDKLDVDGKRRTPFFKPRFDPDRLLAQNYFGHLLVVETELVRSLGGLRPGFEGAQDHDLVLRCTEAVTPGQIEHVPHVLYHWRESAASTALDPRAKPYSDAAGLAAVRDALSRRAMPAVAEPAAERHCYRVKWDLPKPSPRVSIVIPTRDRVELLRTCVESIFSRTRYPSFELTVVDNGSVEAATIEYLRELAHRGVRVLRDEGPFNFSALNNRAVREVDGDLVALVNNDIEVLEPHWLEEMASQASRPDVGAVGALLLYPDGRIQHGGVVLGLRGVAGHAFKHLPSSIPGHFSALRFARTVGAVTAACLVVGRAKYSEVGGFDEEGLPISFNDVDFCMKLGRAGYRNVLTPHAVLMHHESATRGTETDPGQVARARSEQRCMRDRWGRALLEDPYYSPNLTTFHEDYSLRVPR